MLTESAHARNAEIPPSLYIRQVLTDPLLPRTSKLLATAIATLGGGKPCHIPAPDLMRLCGFQKDALPPARRILEDRGYLRTERDGNLITSYRPTLPAVMTTCIDRTMRAWLFLIGIDGHRPDPRVVVGLMRLPDFKLRCALVRYFFERAVDGSMASAQVAEFLEHASNPGLDGAQVVVCATLCSLSLSLDEISTKKLVEATLRFEDRVVLMLLPVAGGTQ